MSFLGPKPEGLRSAQPERTDTRFAGPLPWPHGTHRIAMQHIETPWGYRTEPTGSRGQDPADYHSVAGCICLGPVHALRRIYVGQRSIDVWRDNPEDGSRYLDFEFPYSVGNHSPVRLRFYWGYDDQPVEPILDGQYVTEDYEVWERDDDWGVGAQPGGGGGRMSSGKITYPPAPNRHPPYGGICYAVFYALETGWPHAWVDGQEMGGGPRAAGPTIPPIEFEIYRRPTLTDGGEWHLGVNAIAVAYDYLTDPRAGLGLSSLSVPPADWQAAVDRLGRLRWQGLNRLSPVLSGSTAAATAISKLWAYVGAMLTKTEGSLLPEIMPELGDAARTVWVANAGFDAAGEGGQAFAGWSNAGAIAPVRDEAERWSGSASCRLDSAGGASAAVAQTMATMVPGKNYTMDLMLRRNLSATGLELVLSGATTGAVEISGTDWSGYQVTFVAASNSLTLAISDYPGGSVWVDAVYIRESVTEIAANDLTADPEFKPNDAEDSVSEVTVRFLNLEQKLEDDSVTERLSMPSILRGEPVTEDVDGEFARSPGVARLMAMRVLAGRGGELSLPGVLRSSAVRPDGSPLAAGDVIHLDYEPWSLDVPLRISKVRDNGSDSLRIDGQIETGLYPENYSPAEDLRDLPDEPEPTPFVHARAIELPVELGGGYYPPRAAILAQRENQGIYAMDVYLSTEGDAGERWSGEEALLATQQAFAVHGSLSGAIGDAADQLVIDLESGDYDHFLSEGFSAAGAADDVMLALIGAEWISLRELVDQTGSAWTFGALRGRAGSAPAAHGDGDEVWLVRRSLLLPLAHNSFAAAPTSVWFRAVPKTITSDGDPSADLPLAFADPYPPALALYPLASGSAHLQRARDGSIRARVAISWEEITDPRVLGGGSIQLKYRRSSDSAGVWIDLPAMGVPSMFTYLTGVVEGEVITVRGRLVTHYGLAATGWTEVGPHTVVGKSAPPGDATWGPFGGVTFDPDRYAVTIKWVNPSDLDATTVVVERRIAAGAWDELIQLPLTRLSGYQTHVDQGVAGVGGTQTFGYRIRIIDSSGNPSSNYIEGLVDVPEVPSDGLPEIAKVTGFAVTAAGSATKAARFLATWTGDGAFLDLIRISYYGSADFTDVRTIEVPIGTSGSQSLALDVPRNRYADGTQFTFVAQRGDMEGSVMLWSERESRTANLNAIGTAPGQVSGATRTYEHNRRVRLQYTEPDDPDYSHGNIYAQEAGLNSGNPYLVGRRYKTDMKLLAGNPADEGTAFFVADDIYPAETARTITYSITSVDYQGNESDPVNLDPLTIAPLVFTLPSLSVTPSARSVLISWSGSTSDDVVDVQIWQDGAYGSTNMVRSTSFSGGGLQIDDLPWTGSTKLQMWRGYSINGRIVWSAPSPVQSITVEPWAAPSAVSSINVIERRGAAELNWAQPTGAGVATVEIEKAPAYDWSGGGDPQYSLGPYEVVAQLPINGPYGMWRDTSPPEDYATYAYRIRVIAPHRDAVSAAVVVGTSGGGIGPVMPQPHLTLDPTAQEMTGVSSGNIGLDGALIEDGVAVEFLSTQGSLPAPLKPRTTYYLEYVSGSGPRFYKVYDRRNMTATDQLVISTSGAGTIRCYVHGPLKGAKVRLTVDQFSDVSSEFEIQGGDGDLYDRVGVRFGGGTMPSGIVAGRLYYARKTSDYLADGWRLFEDPFCTAQISMTSQGSGTIYCYPQYIDMDWQESYDSELSHTGIRYATAPGGAQVVGLAVPAGTYSARLRGAYVYSTGMQTPIVRVYDAHGIHRAQNTTVTGF